MDLFRYLEAPDSPFKLGFLIEGASSVTWIERYRDPGEFTVVAPVETGMQSQLPIGAMLSHVSTGEVMVVENHRISDNEDGGVDITVSGRSVDALMEERAVGSNFSGTRTTLLPPLSLPTNNSWTQAVNLINQHITPPGLYDDDDELTNVVSLAVGLSVGTSVAREVERGNLHQRVMEILEVDDLGLKTVRPSSLSPFASPQNETDLAFVIHGGADLSQKVSFAYSDGDLESAEYLWTSKARKTAALVTSKWAQVRVDTGQTGFGRRVMHVDASDIDEEYSEAPTGTTLTAIQDKLEIRGQQAIAAQNDVAIVSVQSDKNSENNIYRQDYNIGDIVAVEGNYNTETTMRVTEHVEIEDDTGGTSYPTLARHY